MEPKTSSNSTTFSKNNLPHSSSIHGHPHSNHQSQFKKNYKTRLNQQKFPTKQTSIDSNSSQEFSAANASNTPCDSGPRESVVNQHLIEIIFLEPTVKFNSASSNTSRSKSNKCNIYVNHNDRTRKILEKAFSQMQRPDLLNLKEISIEINHELQKVKLELNERFKLVQIFKGKELVMPDDTNIFYALTVGSASQAGDGDSSPEGNKIVLCIKYKTDKEIKTQLSNNTGMIRKRQSIGLGDIEFY